MRAFLLAIAIAAFCQPTRSFSCSAQRKTPSARLCAVSTAILGALDQQRAQVAVAALGDAAQPADAGGLSQAAVAQAAGSSDLKVAGLQLDRLAVWRAVGGAVPGVVVTLELLSGACSLLGHQRLQRG